MRQNSLSSMTTGHRVLAGTCLASLGALFSAKADTFDDYISATTELTYGFLDSA